MNRPAALGAARGSWLLATTVYVLAVFHRSSLGVAGRLAEQRFGITAAQLGVFVFVQIGVYALMQVPVGVLVDRYGPRRMLVGASALMALGQVVFAVAPSFPTALGARVLLGCGDAMTFISVLRFIATHFSARRYPVLVTLTGTAGMMGGVLATLPLQQALSGVGWAPTFLVAAALSLVTAVAVWLFLDDHAVPPRRLRTAGEARDGAGAVARRVASAWSLPGTRLGFWVHFATMTSAGTLGLLWGYPYLVDGAGFSEPAAGSLLLIGVVVAALGGPAIGWLIGRHANLRVGVALTVTLLSVTGWASVALVLGDRPPLALVAVLYVFSMVGGPTSMIAFAVARDYNPARIIGTASGVVNVGGFLATALSAIGFGAVVAALGGTSPEHLRAALLVIVVVQAFGASRIVVWVRRVRAQLAAWQSDGTDVPVRVGRHFWWDTGWSDGWSLASGGPRTPLRDKAEALQ